MKKQTNMILTIILLSGIIVNAVSQIVLQSNGNIDIHTPNISGRYTFQYGDLILSGGTHGAGWGWFKSPYLSTGTMSVEGNLQASTNLIIGGSLGVSGNKSFLQLHPTDTAKFIQYFAMESGEALTVAQGVARTVNGEATVALPEHFSLVTNKNEPITVALTPEGAPVLLYAKQKSTKEIVVAMAAADLKKYKDVDFSYQVTGVRDGFENQEIVIGEDKLTSPPPARADVQKRIDTYVNKQNVALVNQKKASLSTTQ